MADFPNADRGNVTPLEVAATPALDAVVQAGILGLFETIPDDLPPGSDVGNLSLFGYDPRVTFTGRAPLEAANQGMVLGANDIAFRCNLVTLEDGYMRDFTAGHITTEEARALIDMLDAELGVGLRARFHAGVSYRHLAILEREPTDVAALQRLNCTPPHDITGQPVGPTLPSGPGADTLLEIMRRSQAILPGHPVNARRRAAGRLPANSVWLWGQGRSPSMTTYPDRFGIRGSVISAVDLVNGIGVCAGLNIVTVPGATGYLDTNYEGKVAAALAALNDVDFVFVHIEAPDETSHEGDFDRKVRAIEDFDRRVVTPCFEAITARGDTRLLVAPDHVTSLASRTHAHGLVPFALCGAGVTPDGARIYSEAAALSADLAIVPGYALVPYLIETKAVTAATLKKRLQKCNTIHSHDQA